MASVTKRGKTWQYAVSRMTDGKFDPIRKGGFKTKKEASIAAAVVEAELGKGLYAPVVDKNISFVDYFTDWVSTYKIDVTSTTLNSYKNTTIKLEDFFGTTSIQHVTKRRYQEFMNDMGEKYGRDSNRKRNGYVRACLQVAIEENMIRGDFTKDVIISGLKSKKDSEKFLNYKDSKRLLHELQNSLTAEEKKRLEKLMLILALTSGMRFGEMVGLVEDDFNFEENTISVRRQWMYKTGGGFGPLKNDNSERILPMNEQTMQLYELYFKERIQYGHNTNKLVFFRPNSEMGVIKNNTLNDMLRILLQELSIKPSISVHGLRHTHASILLYQGISLLYVSERLGHTNIDITTSTYSHVLKELRERDSTQSASIFTTIMTMDNHEVDV